MESNFEPEYGPNLQTGYAEYTNMSLEQWDFIGTEYTKDAFCSTLPASPPALITGSVD